MASERTPWPVPGDAPTADDLTRCVHCGLCLNSCPTYLVTGLEAESPRGRIYLARAVSEGRIDITPAVERHWDLCLQCRACEAVCPSGVPYGRIMEHTRAQVAAAPSSSAGGRRIRRFVLRNVVARPRVLAVAVWPARFYVNSGLRRAMERLRLTRLLGPLRVPAAQLPSRVEAPVRPGDGLPGPDAPRLEAVLFTGCVMGELYGGVHRATARVLAACGVRACASEGQICCGALHAHDGDLEFARRLARKNIDVLGGQGLPIVVNSAGCGAAMKEYGDLLAHDAAYAERARTFSALVKDFSEFVAGLPQRPPGRFDGRVVWQDPCHLAHAQRIREAPRELIREIDGCELVETPGGDVCCGAAGIYSLVQPEMSAQLRARKAAQFAAADGDAVVTANPGCQMQYTAATAEAGVRSRVMHIAELLDEAYGAGRPD